MKVGLEVFLYGLDVVIDVVFLLKVIKVFLLQFLGHGLFFRLLLLRRRNGSLFVVSVPADLANV